jgi:hypothetical protein
VCQLSRQDCARACFSFISKIWSNGGSTRAGSTCSRETLTLRSSTLFAAFLHSQCLTPASTTICSSLLLWKPPRRFARNDARRCWYVHCLLRTLLPPMRPDCCHELHQAVHPRGGKHRVEDRTAEGCVLICPHFSVLTRCQEEAQDDAPAGQSGQTGSHQLVTGGTRDLPKRHWR